jgi:hypothetical protein
MFIIFCSFRDPSLKQDQRDALFQDLQKKLQRAEQLLEHSHDTEKFDGIGEYKLCITVSLIIVFGHCPSSKLFIKKRFESWLCFCHQVKIGTEGAYSVGSLRHS